MNVDTELFDVWELITPATPDTLESLGNNTFIAKWWKPVPEEKIEAFQHLDGIRLYSDPFEPENLAGGLAIHFSIAQEMYRSSSIPQLIKDLADPDFQWSASAKEQLISLGADAVEPLLTALPRTTNKQRWEIIKILARIGDTRPVPIVIGYLKSDNGAIRLAAAQCLGALGDQRATLPLIEAMDSNPDSGALIWIIQALGQLRDKRAIDSLLRIMQETTSSSVRYTAIEALGIIGATQAIDAIRACLEDESHHVRARAQTALELLRTHC